MNIKMIMMALCVIMLGAACTKNFDAQGTPGVDCFAGMTVENGDDKNGDGTINEKDCTGLDGLGCQLSPPAVVGEQVCRALVCPVRSATTAPTSGLICNGHDGHDGVPITCMSDADCSGGTCNVIHTCTGPAGQNGMNGANGESCRTATADEARTANCTSGHAMWCPDGVQCLACADGPQTVTSSGTYNFFGQRLDWFCTEQVWCGNTIGTRYCEWVQRNAAGNPIAGNGGRDGIPSNICTKQGSCRSGQQPLVQDGDFCFCPDLPDSPALGIDAGVSDAGRRRPASCPDGAPPGFPGCECLPLRTGENWCVEGFACERSNDPDFPLLCEKKPDAGMPDSGMDAGTPDSGQDAGQIDAAMDSGTPDSGQPDANLDSGVGDADAMVDGSADAMMDAGNDAATPDAMMDSGVMDTGIRDASAPDATADGGFPDATSVDAGACRTQVINVAIPANPPRITGLVGVPESGTGYPTGQWPSVTTSTTIRWGGADCTAAGFTVNMGGGAFNPHGTQDGVNSYCGTPITTDETVLNPSPTSQGCTATCFRSTNTVNFLCPPQRR